MNHGNINRRTLFKGLVATAAGVLIPGEVAAEPDRRVWALDRTMIPSGLFPIPAGSLVKLNILPLDFEDYYRYMFAGVECQTIALSDGRFERVFKTGSAWL